MIMMTKETHTAKCRITARAHDTGAAGVSILRAFEDVEDAVRLLRECGYLEVHTTVEVPR